MPHVSWSPLVASRARHPSRRGRPFHHPRPSALPTSSDAARTTARGTGILPVRNATHPLSPVSDGGDVWGGAADRGGIVFDQHFSPSASLPRTHDFPQVRSRRELPAFGGSARTTARGTGILPVHVPETPPTFGGSARRIALVLTLLLAALTFSASPAHAQTIIYVNAAAAPGGNGQSWQTAFQDVESALTTAAAVPVGSVEVWVAQGVYKPTRPTLGTNRSRTFELRASVPMKFIGGFAGNEASAAERRFPYPETRLSGDFAGDDTPALGNMGENAYHVVWVPNAGNFTIDGFTITGGNSDGNDTTGDNVLWPWGGGIYAYSRTRGGVISLTLRACVLFNNRSAFSGAGFYMASREEDGFVLSLCNVDRCSFVRNVGTAGSPGDGMYFNRVDAAVTNSLVASNARGGALLRTGQVTTLFQNNTVVNNGVGDSGARGLYVYDGPVVVSNCLFRGNGTGDQTSQVETRGVALGTTTFRYCSIQGWTGSLGGVSNNAANPQFVDPDGIDNVLGTIDDNYTVSAGSSAIDSAETAAVSNSLIADLAGNFRRVDGDSNSVVEIDRGAYEFGSTNYTPILYVKLNATGDNSGYSWSNALSGSLGLQNAMAIATLYPGAFAQIRVAAGTYKPSQPLTQGGSRSASFQLQNNLAIYGGFAGNETELSQRNIAANETILSGDLNGDDNGDLNRADNSYHVVNGTGSDASSVLDGFTITAGAATSDYPNSTGGGLYLYPGSPTIRNTVFLSNKAAVGGAAYIVSSSCPVFTDCKFQGNLATLGQAGAVYLESTFSPNFLRCLFEDNVAMNGRGGAFEVFGATGQPVRFALCEFRRNRCLDFGGAGSVWVGGTAVFVGCRWFGNSAQFGYAMYLYGAGTTADLVNCAVVGNGPRSAEPGMALVVDYPGSALNLTNCVVACNTSTPAFAGGGGVLYYAGGSVHISNSILFGNRTSPASGLQEQQLTDLAGQGGFSTIAHTLVEGWTGSLGGTGNNGLDPRFRRLPSPGADNQWGTPDDDYGDLRVTNGSPATDSGDSTAVPLDTFDIDGDGNTTESLPWDLDGNNRFVDDPLVANTGVGNPPVDRGCYEFVPPVITAPGERRWVSPSGGDFASLFNWFPAVPGALDDAVFDISSAYTVNFPLSPPAQNRRLLVRRGGVVFDLGASTYNISSPFEPAMIIGDLPGVPAALSIINGTLSPFAGLIGAEPGSIGSLIFSGPSARMTMTQGDLSVGFFGQGHMLIEGGARVTTRTAGVGDQSGSQGSSVTVTGTGSRWTVPFLLTINNGSVTVRDGATLENTFGIVLFQGATLSGNGTINGPVINFGAIEPGNSPGVLTINGAYTQVGTIAEFGADSGKLRSQVAGSLPGQYDRLQVNGQATLGGGLFVEFLSGYVPTPNAQGNYPALPLLQSTQPLASRFDVAFFPPVPAVQGQSPKFLRAVYPNRGPGTVELVVADLGVTPDFNDPSAFQLDGGPTAADIGDLNNDGRPDLAIALPDATDPLNNNGDVVILFNLGNDAQGNWLGFGNSTQVTVGRNPSGVAIGDFDGQNGNDVAATNMNSNSVSFLSQQATSGAFLNNLTLSVGNEPTALAAFSLDRVGRVDLAVVNGGDNNVMMMANTNTPGVPGFSPLQTVPVGIRPVAIRPFNPDNDKDVDVAVANSGSSSMSVMSNQGFGTFNTPQTVGVGAEPVALVAGSLLARGELDRRQDLVVINRSGTGGAGSLSVVVNTTPIATTDALSFAPGVEYILQTSNPAGSMPRSVAMVDLDADHDLDIAVLARDAQDTAVTVRLLRNDLNGGEQLAFVESAQLDAGLSPVAILTADVDGDGQPDLITVNGGLRGPGSGGSVNVLRNAFTPPPPPCRADFDGNGLVQVPDIFAFLSAWFALDPRADFNGIQGVNVPDIFAFLSAWFAGCP